MRQLTSGPNQQSQVPGPSSGRHKEKSMAKKRLTGSRLWAKLEKKKALKTRRRELGGKAGNTEGRRRESL